MTRSRVLKSLVALVATALIAMGGVAPSQAEVTPAKTINTKTVGMQMFMWNWKSLKNECRTSLGPAGVDWILVMPPQKSTDGSAWWTHYQPMSYSLDSTLGTEAEFKSMVATCNEYGVDVIADAVINHMTTGVYDYPEVGYTQSNFHFYSPEHNCKTDISNWGDINESTNCMLGGLPDLATEQPFVQGKIAGYLNSLLAAGVKGFRIDAARHIPIADLLAIKSQLTNPDVFIINEVAGSPPEPAAFAPVGATFSFDWSGMLKDAFSGFNGAYDLDIPNSQYRGMGDPLKTVTMVQNHDTERSGASISYAHGKGFLLASIYTLTEPFGMPMLYSGFVFNDFNDSPRVNSSGYNTCNTGSGPKTSYTAQQMVCTSRWTAIKGMVRWHKYMDGKTKTKMWSNNYAYGYARGANGYVLFNTKASTAKFSKLSTGLPMGHYCDVVSGGANPVKVVKGKKSCVGTTITVAKGGYLAATLPSMTAVAIATYAKY